YFAPAAFEPTSAGGLALLGHELVHTTQQQGSALPRPPLSGPISRRAMQAPERQESESPALEQQALHAEARLLRLMGVHEPLSPSHLGPRAVSSINVAGSE